MFKKMMVFALAMNAINSHALTPFPPSHLRCSNLFFAFSIFEESKIGSVTDIFDFQDPNPFGGVSLVLDSSERAHYSSKTQYSTMNGGTLIISKQVSRGGHGCGRGSCDGLPQNVISAFYSHPGSKYPNVSSKYSDPFFYDCDYTSF
jgi:hypothetical protein